MDDQLERLAVSPKEAAGMIGCDVSFVYAWVRSGELPAFNVGRAIKIPTEAIPAFIRRKAGILDDSSATADRWSAPRR